MTAADLAPDPYNVIHLGGEAAVVVPIDEYRRLRALERTASAAELEEAEELAAVARYRDWVAAGQPGAIGHDEVMAELIPSPR